MPAAAAAAPEGAPSTGAGAPESSFLLVSPELEGATAEGGLITRRVREAGLTVERRERLPLSRAAVRRLLFLITPHLRAPLPVPSAGAVRDRKFGLATTRAFGGEAFTAAPAVPSEPDVDVFAGDRPPTVLLLRAVDPRVDVPGCLAGLVGPDAAADVRRARGSLREAFDAREGREGAWRVACPRTQADAARALPLLKRLLAAAAAAAVAPAPSLAQKEGAGAGGGDAGQHEGGAPAAAAAAATAATASATAGASRRHGALLRTLTAAGPFPSGARQGKDALVDVDAVLAFAFPPGQQWPRSTGRLLLYGAYGPLTAAGGLTGGRRSGRPLTDKEIEAAIQELERDDLLAVYTRGSVMGDVGQVLSDVRAASRRLPDLTRAQVIAMLVDLPRDARGFVSFHDVQQRLMRARVERVALLGELFPALVARRDADVARLSIAAPPTASGAGTLRARLEEEAELGASLAAGGVSAAVAARGLGSFRALVTARETHRLSLHAAATGRPVPRAAAAAAEAAGDAGAGFGAGVSAGASVGSVGTAAGAEHDAAGSAAGGDDARGLGSSVRFDVTSGGGAGAHAGAHAPPPPPPPPPVATGAGAPPVSPIRPRAPPTLGVGTMADLALFPRGGAFDSAVRPGTSAGAGTSRGAGAPRGAGARARHARAPSPADGLDPTRKLGEVERARFVAALLHRNLSLVSTTGAASAAAAGAAAVSSLLVRPDVPARLDGFDRYAPLSLHRAGASHVPGGLTRSDMQRTKVI